jgi:damage-control phosphatase, subfamily I
MHTALDCLPCFLQQSLAAARRITGCEEMQRLIMVEMVRYLSSLDLEASPPENAMGLYQRLAELAGSPDPYADLKEESNRLALLLLPRQAALVDKATDPLLAAVKVAIAGNIIDYGAPHQFDFSVVLENASRRELAIDDYLDFRRDLARAETVLYLADNCGELVFDRLLIERLDRKVVLAVKEKPIINDALTEDARRCGLDRFCTIITNGTACPGTPLPRCSPTFQDAFQSADLIISKGQGNFETLSATSAPVYFLLTVKCLVVAAHIEKLAGTGVRLGESVLLKAGHRSRAVKRSGAPKP